MYKHEYQHNDNISGDQLLQVLNYQLVTFKQTKWNLLFGIPAQLKDSHAQVDTWTTCDHMTHIYVESVVS